LIFARSILLDDSIWFDGITHRCGSTVCSSEIGMTALRRPASPKVYHITHVDNLSGIVRDGCLWADSLILQREGPFKSIGMPEIKQRRMRIEVKCCAGTVVGDYVPFYFCPRSIMLYVIHRSNHPGLAYRGGQKPIVHLEADLLKVIDWANKEEVRWAVSLSNAGASYVQFRNDLAVLDELDWDAIAASDFRNPDIKERKQAEFLVYGMFPFDLVERIGVFDSQIQTKAQEILSCVRYPPPVEIKGEWYY